MSRAPFQVLVLPFRSTPQGTRLYAVFRRADNGCWQWIAGGGEDAETPLQAAKREAFEEAGIPDGSRFTRLETVSMIPVAEICGFRWGPEVLVIPEHCFGVEVSDERLTLSGEHVEFRWVPYEEARELLRWDSNRNALWELDHRLRDGLELPT